MTFTKSDCYLVAADRLDKQAEDTELEARFEDKDGNVGQAKGERERARGYREAACWLRAEAGEG